MPQLGKAGAIAALLLFGTLTSLVAKIVYEVNGPGLDGVERYFRKPWFMTSTPFLGMVWCLPFALLEQRKRRAKASANGEDISEPLLSGTTSASLKHTARNEFVGSLKLAVPAMFDICATALMNTGLLSVTASVYQMMRGAEMLFAALLAVTILKRKLNKLHYLGLTACIAGIVIVGTASVLSGSGGTQVAVSKGQIVVGMVLIVLSQAVQAGQITFEDHFLCTIEDITPMKIVGYEGLYGSVMMAVLLFVVTYLPGREGEGIHENIFDTAHMLAHSPQVAAWVLTQIAGLLFYNIGGMTVTGLLGAVFRSILETTRTLFVWLVGLVLYYTGTGLGEQWDAWSFLQLAGFLILVAGTVIYGRGDERAAAEYVENVFANGDASIEDAVTSQTEPITVDPNMMDAPAAQPIGMPASSANLTGSSPGRQSAAMAMPGSSWHYRSSIAANSYQEAVALNMRKRAASSGNLMQQD